MAYRKYTSPVWEFFDPPTVKKVNGKDVKWVQSVLCTQQLANDGGTSNICKRNFLKSTRGVRMTLAKAVRHRVYSIASRGCVHRSTLLPSQASLLRGIFALSVLFWWAGLLGWSLLPYQNLVGGAVFILQLSVCFTFRISGCRKPTSIAALVQTPPFSAKNCQPFEHGSKFIHDSLLTRKLFQC